MSTILTRRDALWFKSYPQGVGRYRDGDDNRRITDASQTPDERIFDTSLTLYECIIYALDPL